MRSPDKRGYFGPFGGKFVPETLMAALSELEREYKRARSSGAFKRKLDYYLKDYAGLKKEVVICGLSNRLEIWDAEKWETYKKTAEKGVDEIVSKLGGLGI